MLFYGNIQYFLLREKPFGLFRSTLVMEAAKFRVILLNPSQLKLSYKHFCFLAWLTRSRLVRQHKRAHASTFNDEKTQQMKILIFIIIRGTLPEMSRCLLLPQMNRSHK